MTSSKQSLNPKKGHPNSMTETTIYIEGKFTRHHDTDAGIDLHTLEEIHMEDNAHTIENLEKLWQTTPQKEQP